MCVFVHISLLWHPHLTVLGWSAAGLRMCVCECARARLIPALSVTVDFFHSRVGAFYGQSLSLSN